MQQASVRTRAATCARCGYANALTWPSCISCGRSLRRSPANLDRSHIAGLWPATRLVPACASATMAFAMVAREPQRTELLLLAGITTTVTLAALSMTPRPVPAVVPVATQAARPRRVTSLSDAELRAALADW